MIYRCPNCNGALEYNPVTDEMECAHCGGGYTIQEMESKSQKVYDYVTEKSVMSTITEENATSVMRDGIVAKTEMVAETDHVINDFEDEHNIYANKERMECKIYTCTSCGAELAVSDTEVSTWCAYCGQPTIVYSRVSNELKPDYVIPFKITREQAIRDIRKKVHKGLFTPKAVKNFEIEKVRGIYIPHFMFDVHYRNNQKIHIYKSSKHTEGYWFTAECDFEKMSCDASSYLEDELTQRLEPYDFKDLKEFNAAYLSGFYAERYDLDTNALMDVLKQRCEDLYVKRVERELGANPGFVSRVEITHPKCSVEKADYVLLPVWFLTFRYKNEPYTILMNGQNGKIVGATPFDVKKVLISFLLIHLIVGLIIFALYKFEVIGALIGMIGIGFVGPLILYIFGFVNFSKYNKNLLLAKLTKTAKFVKERQESDEWMY
ncbi:MAG: hypothetical protein IJ397_03020 [Lachnospiraceae bacterium]|nr:hypothetical protein [Lachnospiraceae bacterium]